MVDRALRAEVLIELGPGGGDELDGGHDRGTEQLRRRLRELDVEDVSRPGDDGGDALVVQLAPVLPALHDVVHTVRAWLSTNPDRVVSLAIGEDRIEVTDIGVSDTAADEQRELVRSWTERNSPTEL
jgi:hypothetical protein